MMKKNITESEMNALGVVKDYMIESLRAINEMQKHGTINSKEYEQIEHSFMDVFETLSLNDIETPIDDYAKIVERMKENA
tara:strand:+ start:838 stop:1077 length:240 start_codon:yes stop_codon:yes gene_type:complete